MSWLAKNRLMVLLFAFPFLLACEDPSDIGSSLITDNQVGVFFTDTLSVNTSTMLLDSVITSGASILLAGKYTDPIFGKTEARTYFEVANLDSLTTQPQRVDSVILKLVYSSASFAYGDTNRLQTLAVYPLQEALSTSTTYFNYSSANYQTGTPLGSSTFRASPVVYKSEKKDTIARLDTVKIRLSKDFASYLASISTKSQSRFKTDFKGLVVTPGVNDNAAILGFSPTTSSLVMYYTDADNASKSITYYLSVGNSSGIEQNARFNQLQSNRQGTAVSSLLKIGDIITSAKTNNLAYLQSGVGLVTKMNFPSLTAFKNAGKVAINKAELIINTVPNSITDQTPAPISLVMAELDEKNVILRHTDGTRQYILTEGQTDILQSPLTYGKYTFNLTNYFEGLLTGRRTSKGVVLMPLAVSNISRVALQGNKNIKLRIYYTYSPN